MAREGKAEGRDRKERLRALILSWRGRFGTRGASGGGKTNRGAELVPMKRWFKRAIVFDTTALGSSNPPR